MSIVCFIVKFLGYTHTNKIFVVVTSMIEE